ncbi:hypothetical protein StoSoilB3_37600 [Arthrobacter sp. StoSoilB3]|nr:hypothetical protein StoSoilB3_37600 [Arthrobacter sp. StoSoilB3]
MEREQASDSSPRDVSERRKEGAVIRQRASKGGTTERAEDDRPLPDSHPAAPATPPRQPPLRDKPTGLRN